MLLPLLQKKKSLLQELLLYSQQALLENIDEQEIDEQRHRVLEELDKLESRIEEKEQMQTKQEQAYLLSFTSLLSSIEANNDLLLSNLLQHKEELDLERKEWQNIPIIPVQNNKQQQPKHKVAAKHVINTYKA